jgi:hypothetical protein
VVKLHVLQAVAPTRLDLPVGNEKKECVNECVNESIEGRLEEGSKARHRRRVVFEFEIACVTNAIGASQEGCTGIGNK